MSNFKFFTVLLRRYVIYVVYFGVLILIHFSASLVEDLNLVLSHNYIGFILLSSIGLVNTHEKININKVTLKLFYLVNIIYYFALFWYSLSMSLDLYNHILSGILLACIIGILINKLQNVLILNKPMSKHDKKLKQIERLNSKLPYFKTILSREDLNDGQKLQFLKTELNNFDK
jgi:hypothetical protein